MDLQFDPIARLSTTSYCLTLKTKDHEIQHMQLKLVHKIHLQCGNLLRHTSSTDTWICAVPKQSRGRPMALQKYVHQNNLVTDLWLYYKVYLAPKQSRTDL